MNEKTIERIMQKNAREKYSRFDLIMTGFFTPQHAWMREQETCLQEARAVDRSIERVLASGISGALWFGAVNLSTADE
jgi:hypothetical protein